MLGYYAVVCRSKDIERFVRLRNLIGRQTAAFEDVIVTERRILWANQVVSNRVERHLKGTRGVD